MSDSTSYGSSLDQEQSAVISPQPSTQMTWDLKDGSQSELQRRQDS